MLILYSIFFGAGVGAFAYTKMGRRLGYENSQNVTVVVGLAFIFSAIIFYTMMAFVFGF